MDEQNISILELTQLALFLGSLTYLLGLIYQVWIAVSKDGKIKRKVIILAVATRLLTVFATLVVWSFWTTGIDIMFGFILLPALIPELIFTPLLLKLFGYPIWRTSENPK